MAGIEIIQRCHFALSLAIDPDAIVPNPKPRYRQVLESQCLIKSVGFHLQSHMGCHRFTSGGLNIKIPFSCLQPVEFLVLEVANVEKIHATFCDQLVKVVVNEEPVLAVSEEQRNPNDAQYVSTQDGFFLYSLKGILTTPDINLQLVFWKIEVEHLLLKVSV